MIRYLLKLAYSCILLPVFCLGILPSLRILVQKIVNDSLSYTPLELFFLISFLVLGIALSVFVDNFLSEDRKEENRKLLVIGLAVILIGSCFVKMTIPNYFFFIYGLPYSGLYLGSNIYLLKESFQKKDHKYRKT